MREKILLAGDMGTSKSMTIVKLALMYPNKRIGVLDPDDGILKLIAELEGEGRVDPTVGIPNLIRFPVSPDWENMMTNYHMLKMYLGCEDWFCMDMMGRFWDFAQNYYSRQVFGVSPSQHILKLREEAAKVNFGGFDGLTDWTIIKRMHNEELVDDALLWSPFNVLATTSIKPFLPVEKAPKVGVEGLIASEFAVKIEGEKHNVYRFDTIAILQRKKEGNFVFRLAKDKGRPIDPKLEYDFTNRSFWEVYGQMRGLL